MEKDQDIPTILVALKDFHKKINTPEFIKNPHKGQSFGDLYKLIFSESANKTIFPSFI